MTKHSKSTAVRSTFERPALPLILVTLIGLILSLPLLYQECRYLEQIPKLWGQSIFEKKYAVDGPLYILTMAGEETMMPEASVTFLTAAEGAAREYYEKKLWYYLWPRTIRTESPTSLKWPPGEKDLTDYYAAFAGNKDELNALEPLLQKISRSPGVKKIFEYRTHGYFVIYQILQRKQKS